jgi:penicillin-binding protein 1A
MGVRSQLLPVPSAVLGSNGVSVLDMADVYSTLADDGTQTDPVFVTRITKRDGTVLWKAPSVHRPALAPNTARRVTGVLQQVVARGTGVNAKIGRPVAGKTGTSEEWADAWFVGYTPDLVAAVWVGFPDRERTMRPPTTRTTVTGGTWPAQIWQDFAGAALAETPATAFPQPTADPPRPRAAPTTTTLAGSPLPSVLGMPALQGARILLDRGYRVKTVDVPSRRYPPGIIAAQDPPGGRAARPGTTVTIEVANGPPRSVPVPTVLGQLPDEAAAALRAAGFEVALRVEAEPPPGSPERAGRVWKQSPIGGTTSDSGSTVTLWSNP